MRGETHAAVGTVTALFIAQPKSITEIAIVASAGLLGGLFLDVDTKHSKGHAILKQALFFIGIVASAFVISYSSNTRDIGADLQTLLSLKPLIGIIGLIALALFGSQQPHRMVTHSIEFIILTGTCAGWINSIFCTAFIIGEISHVVLDILNRRPVKLSLFFNMQICLNLCRSNGLASGALTALAAMGTMAYPIISSL